MVRDISVDWLKGIAIFLVVIGHLLQGSIVDFDHNLTFRIIYSFHMPLFFFLSGYVAYLSKQVGLVLLKRRFLSLMMPFLIWIIVSFFLKNNSSISVLKYLAEVLYTPDKGLWFLWILFFCYIFISFAKQIPLKLETALLLISVLIIIISVILNDDIFGIKLFGKEFPFFAFGFLSNKYKKSVIPITKKYFVYSLALFICGVNFWMRNSPPTFYTSPHFSKLFLFGYTIIVAALAIFSFFGFAHFVKIDKASKIIMYIGQHSLSIYAIHFFFLRYFFKFYILIGNYSLSILLFSLLLIVVCLFIEYLISFNSLLAFLFFAKQKKTSTKKI